MHTHRLVKRHGGIKKFRAPVESGMGFQEIVKQQILSNSQLYSDTMLFFENVSDAKSSDF